MTGQPTALSASLSILAAELAAAEIAVIDFETTGTKNFSQIVGTGIYLPETGRAFYINSGHGIIDPKFPLYPLPQLSRHQRRRIQHPPRIQRASLHRVGNGTRIHAPNASQRRQPTHQAGGPMKELFALGQIVATPPAMEALQRNGQTAVDFLDKHKTGDWGCVCKDDARANKAAIKDGSRIFSTFRLNETTKIWIITEAVGPGGRSSTCIMLQDDY